MLKGHRVEVFFSHHMIKSALYLITVLLLLLFSFPLGQALAQEAPVWTFDFRDVFYDVTFIDTQTAVIVGAGGRILVSHETYKNLWSPRDSLTRELLTCVSFPDATHGWAAGHGGVIIHTADGGRTWEIQRESSTENQPLFDIQFVSQNVGYACGSYDTLLKSTDGGKAWQAIPTGYDKIYNALAFLDEERGYLVGEAGTVMLSENGGTSWKQIDMGGYRGAFFGITILSPQQILICGISGKIMRSDDGGHTWESIPSGTTESLFRGAVNGKDVAVVGRSGTILLSRDGGRSFVEKRDTELTSFAGVCSHPQGGFVCVGEIGKISRIESPGKD